ncbi:MAG: hypothetical protein ACLSFT_08945 [Ruminococcus callidus]
MQKMIPRLLISAVGSGTGKTTVTAALLSAFCARGMRVQSLKCGPDYIDPMFHSHITGRPAYHADPFSVPFCHAGTGFPCQCRCGLHDLRGGNGLL